VTDEQFGTDPALEIETDFFIVHGHHYTCNGGNPDWRSHHDHEVVLVRDGDVLRCPECNRTQPLRRLMNEAELDARRAAIIRAVRGVPEPEPDDLDAALTRFETWLAEHPVEEDR
jgi:hypothetical protein